MSTILALLSIVADFFKLAGVAEALYQRASARHAARVQANVPLTNEEENADIDKLPGA